MVAVGFKPGTLSTVGDDVNHATTALHAIKLNFIYLGTHNKNSLNSNSKFVYQMTYFLPVPNLNNFLLLMMTCISTSIGQSPVQADQG